MNKSYTPGPWTVGGQIYLDNYPYPILCNREMKTGLERSDIAYINDTHVDYEANSRLISSAPDLVWAVENLLLIAEAVANEGNIVVKRSKEILAAATGKEKTDEK